MGIRPVPAASCATVPFAGRSQSRIFGAKVSGTDGRRWRSGAGTRWERPWPQQRDGSRPPIPRSIPIHAPAIPRHRVRVRRRLPSMRFAAALQEPGPNVRLCAHAASATPSHRSSIVLVGCLPVRPRASPVRRPFVSLFRTLPRPQNPARQLACHRTKPAGDGDRATPNMEIVRPFGQGGNSERREHCRPPAIRDDGRPLRHCPRAARDPSRRTLPVRRTGRPVAPDRASERHAM